MDVIRTLTIPRTNDIIEDENETKRKDTTMKQAIKFAFGTSRTERANEKERKGNNSGIMMRETVGAPRRLEKDAAEMLKRDNRTHPRTTK